MSIITYSFNLNLTFHYFSIFAKLLGDYEKTSGIINSHITIPFTGRPAIRKTRI
jgi:hypothetical protein